MFDIGWQELFVLAVLAIIVIGPKDLPRAIKTVTHWVRKARGMARDLQDGLDDMVREADLDDIKKEANSIMGDGMDPGGAIARELDMSDEQQDWSKAVDEFKDATDPDKDLEEDVDDAMQVEPEDVSDSASGAAPAAPEEAPFDTIEPDPAPEVTAAPTAEADTSKASG